MSSLLHTYNTYHTYHTYIYYTYTYSTSQVTHWRPSTPRPSPRVSGHRFRRGARHPSMTSRSCTSAPCRWGSSRAACAPCQEQAGFCVNSAALIQSWEEEYRVPERTERTAIGEVNVYTNTSRNQRRHERRLPSLPVLPDTRDVNTHTQFTVFEQMHGGSALTEQGGSNGALNTWGRLRKLSLSWYSRTTYEPSQRRTVHL